MSKERTLLGYAHAWLVAADGQATAAKEQGVDGEVAGMMCIVALQNSVVGAARVLGNDDVAVTECLTQVKDLKNVRDMLTHFDEYIAGSGRLQKGEKGAEGTVGWWSMWSSPEVMTLMNRAKGDEVPTEYTVWIHDALTAVAHLVATAAKQFDVPPSPLLEKLTGQEGGS